MAGQWMDGTGHKTHDSHAQPSPRQVGKYAGHEGRDNPHNSSGLPTQDDDTETEIVNAG